MALRRCMALLMYRPSCCEFRIAHMTNDNVYAALVCTMPVPSDRCAYMPIHQASRASRDRCECAPIPRLSRVTRPVRLRAYYSLVCVRTSLVTYWSSGACFVLAWHASWVYNCSNLSGVPDQNSKNFCMQAAAAWDLLTGRVVICSWFSEVELRACLTRTHIQC